MLYPQVRNMQSKIAKWRGWTKCLYAQIKTLSEFYKNSVLPVKYLANKHDNQITKMYDLKGSPIRRKWKECKSQ